MTDERNPIESIASEFADSLRGGERDAIDPVVSANPELETELRDLLPVIAKLERARQNQMQRPGGLASLGSSRPDRLGDFELTRQIGRGGMGVVFEAVQKTLGRKVAVKVLPMSLLVDGHQLERFQQEARTAASLHHTNIVPVFGVGEDQGFHYYVMQRIDGKGLDRFLGDGEAKLSPRQVAMLGHQAACAISHAHQQNVLHRDIKPANLIVNDELELWVTDFGVAKAIESEAVTQTGDAVGTLRYMAPEQIVGNADVRSDIFSLGITLYELLAGRPAMDDASIREALVSRKPAPVPPRLRSLNPDVPRDLETILHTAMATEPNFRYQNSEALAEDLESFLEGGPISVRPLSTLEKATRWAKRNPAVACLSALSMLLLIGITIASTIGFLTTKSALERERIAHIRSEASSEIASGALNHIFDRFGSRAKSNEDGTESFSSAPALSVEAASLLEDLLEYYDGLAARSNSDKSLEQAASNARYAIGEIHFKLGHYDRAIEAMSLLLEDLVRRPAQGAHAVLHEAKIRNQIGLAHRLSGHTEQADAEHLLAKEMLDGLEATRKLTDQESYELARSCYLLTSRLLPGMGPNAMPPTMAIAPRWRREREDGSPTHAPKSLNEQELATLDRAVSILGELRASKPNHVDYGIALALATNLREKERLRQQRKMYSLASRDGIELARVVMDEHPENATAALELATLLADVDVLGPRLGATEVDAIVEQLEEALFLLEDVSSLHPNVPKFTNALAHTYFKLAVLLERNAASTFDQRRRELEQRATVSYAEAAKNYRILVERNAQAKGYRAWRAVFAQRYASLASRLGLHEQTVDAIELAIDDWIWMTKNHPKETIAWVAIPDAFRTLADAQHRLDNHVEGEAAIKEAHIWERFRELVE